MSQVLEYKSPTIIHPTKISMTSRTSSSSTSTSYELVFELDKDFEVNKQAVEVVNDAIEINEDQLERDRIYPVIFGGEQFYVWNNNGATEIFQLEE